jgi:hypothetical protein
VRLDALEANDAVQDNRLDALEAAGSGGGDELGPVPASCALGIWPMVNGSIVYPDGKVIWDNGGILARKLRQYSAFSVTVNFGTYEILGTYQSPSFAGTSIVAILARAFALQADAINCMAGLIDAGRL